MNKLFLFNPMRKVLQILVLLAILLFQLGMNSTAIAHALTCLLNDTFECRTLINTSAYAPAPLDTTGATIAGETGEQGVSVICNPHQPEDNRTLYLGHKTVWYEYTPTADASIYMDTLGSNYDTYIAVWVDPTPGTGTTLSELSLFACDDDTLAGKTSQLSFNGKAGTTYYIQIAQYNGYYLNGVRTIPTGGLLKLKIYDIPGVGVYDDKDAHWSYLGSSWAEYSGSEPYNSTLHFTPMVGDIAWFPFSGTQFILTYTQFTNRGTIDVYVDGTRVGTINANGALQWQKTYTSLIFPAGNHVVQFKHAGGSYIDIDAIQILNTAAPGVGVYDDTYSNWSYAGSWLLFSGNGPFNNTLHYTAVTGTASWFSFSGTQFILTYTQATNRGSYDVYVDGDKVGTINANSAMQWQKTYTSPIFLNGTHLVQFKFIGGGQYMDVDAIQVLNTAAPGAGTYDDMHFNWAYNGSWLVYSGAGPASNTVHYTTAIGASASFTFSGTQFILTYTQATNRGNYDVYVDGSKLTTINATGPLLWQQMYISPAFSLGTHVVQFKFAGGEGGYMDVDVIKVLDTVVPGVGLYDNTDANWSYTGAWSIFNGIGPYNNTLRYTSTLGDSASFIFNGTQFFFRYTQYSNRGNYDVYVDGGKVSTINAGQMPLVWQQTYTSPVFPAGMHVVQFKFVGPAGAYIDIDAIQILNTPAPGAGTYDDLDSNWAYNGSWLIYNGSGPVDNTVHYTSAVGDIASFTFSGTQFILTYTQATNRGNYDVYVDGNKIGTINANGSMQWQQIYTSPIFPDGTHVVKIKYVGGSGAFMDVDAIQVLNTVAPGAGTYDDIHFNWAYNGSWLVYNGAGPSNNTVHYTTAIDASASFTFNGTQFVLTYTQATNRGNYDVYVDGSKVGTVHAIGSLIWQQVYTSPVFSAGTHVVQFKFVDPLGTYMDVDAITIY